MDEKTEFKMPTLQERFDQLEKEGKFNPHSTLDGFNIDEMSVNAKRRKDNSLTFEFDWVSDDNPNAIIDLLKPTIKTYIHGYDNIIYFGYKFRDDVSNEIKSKFKSFIRKIKYNEWLNNPDYVQFINKPLIQLNDEEIRLFKFKGIFHPESGSDVNKSINSLMRGKCGGKSFLSQQSL